MARHTRYEYAPADEADIIAETYLINGFIGTFLE